MHTYSISILELKQGPFISVPRSRHVESCRWKILAKIRCYGTIDGPNKSHNKHKLGVIQGGVLSSQWETITTLGFISHGEYAWIC